MLSQRRRQLLADALLRQRINIYLLQLPQNAIKQRTVITHFLRQILGNHSVRVRIRGVITFQVMCKIMVIYVVSTRSFDFRNSVLLISFKKKHLCYTKAK